MAEEKHIPIRSGSKLPPFTWDKMFDPEYMGKLVSQFNALCNCPQIQLSEKNAAITTSAAGSSVQMFRLKSVQGDYLTCRTWNGTTEGSTDVLLAKNPKLRTSITSAVIDGRTVNYTYTSPVERTANDGTRTEPQVIVPRYLTATADYPGDVVFAVKTTTAVKDADNKPISWVDLNVDGRAWVQKETV